MKKILFLFLALVLAMSNLCVAFAAVDLEESITLDCTPRAMAAVVDTTGFSAGSRISVLIYPETASDITQMIYADGANITVPGTELQFSYLFTEADPEVRYTVKFSYSLESSSGVSYAYSWKRISDSRMNGMLNDFKTVTADNFSVLYLNAVSEEMIPSVNGLNNPQTLGAYFVTARDAFASGALDDEFLVMENEKDVIRVLEAAILLRELQTGTADSVKAALKKYHGLLPELFTKTPDYNEFASLYVIKPYASQDELLNAIRLALALSEIKGGTYEDIAFAIRRYATVLGINLTELSEKNISVEALAKELDNTVPASYLDGLTAELPAILEKITPNTNVGGGVVVRPPVGGGGGGGGGGFIGNYGGTTPELIPEPTKIEKLPFTDLSDYSWALEAIADLYADNIVNGVSEASFEPGRAVKREEFVKMLVVAFDLQAAPDSKMNFSDCAIDFWAYPYIETAFANGIISGRSDGTFGVGDAITRQDVAVICGNILRSKNIAMSFDAEQEVYSDQQDISTYAKNAVLAMRAGGIISGYPDGSFQPLGDTGRAEVSVVLKRLMNYAGGNK